MLYCKDNKGELRKIAYGTPEQNLHFIQCQDTARKLLATGKIVTTGAILVVIK